MHGEPTWQLYLKLSRLRKACRHAGLFSRCWCLERHPFLSQLDQTQCACYPATAINDKSNSYIIRCSKLYMEFLDYIAKYSKQNRPGASKMSRKISKWRLCSLVSSNVVPGFLFSLSFAGLYTLRRVIRPHAVNAFGVVEDALMHVVLLDA